MRSRTIRRISGSSSVEVSVRVSSTMVRSSRSSWLDGGGLPKKRAFSPGRRHGSGPSDRFHHWTRPPARGVLENLTPRPGSPGPRGGIHGSRWYSNRPGCTARALPRRHIVLSPLRVSARKTRDLAHISHWPVGGSALDGRLWGPVSEVPDRTFRENARWGVIALLLGACAAEHVAPPSQGGAPQARCADLSAPRGTPGALTSSGSPVLCD